jgi:hypothetical protein
VAGHYGVSWLRGTHASADVQVGEGVYVYQVGALKGGIGSAGIKTAGVFYGNGSGITALNAANLASGTVPDARLSGTYTGVNISGNAGTATALQTARTINGVSFNGTANITIADNTKVPTARSVIAGAGLSGGGALGTDITMTLGMPGSVTSQTSNSVTTNSHTHALILTTTDITDLNAGAAAGAVGTYALCVVGGGGGRTAGSTVAGSNLRYAAADGFVNGTPAGTWRLMGAVYNADGSSSDSTTLCLRIS